MGKPSDFELFYVIAMNHLCHTLIFPKKRPGLLEFRGSEEWFPWVCLCCPCPKRPFSSSSGATVTAAPSRASPWDPPQSAP